MKPINSPERQLEALDRFDWLDARRDRLTEDERDELEILIVLLAAYENEHQPVPPPTPLEAIRLHMMHHDLKSRDLGILVGGPNRASEILAGKRQLMPAMMRRLHREWGIPAESLLGVEAEAPAAAPPPARDPGDYPLKEMYARSYIPGRRGDWKKHGKDKPGLLRRFFEAGSSPPVPALHRKGGGAAARINPHALEAWGRRVLTRAEEEGPAAQWNPETLDDGFLRWLASLSCVAGGPRLACEELAERGLAVIVEPRLPGTHLDGAAMLSADGRPVIGLTLRHDRLDNFWFVLFHELGHVRLHLRDGETAIFDSDLDAVRSGEVEQQADAFALDTLIPPEAWEQVRGLNYAAEIRAAASRLRVGASVIAGRLRREANDYRKHRTLVGQGKVRELFDDPHGPWPK